MMFRSILALLLLATPAHAQETATPESSTIISNQINNNFPDNTSGKITPAKLRAVQHTINASMVNQTQIGTSGATIPLLNGANTWSGAQTFSVPIIVGTSTYADLYHLYNTHGAGVLAYQTPGNYGAVTGLARTSDAPSDLGSTIAGTFWGVNNYNGRSVWTLYGETRNFASGGWSIVAEFEASELNGANAPGTNPFSYAPTGMMTVMQIGSGGDCAVEIVCPNDSGVNQTPYAISTYANFVANGATAISGINFTVGAFLNNTGLDSSSNVADAVMMTRNDMISWYGSSATAVVGAGAYPATWLFKIGSQQTYAASSGNPYSLLALDGTLNIYNGVSAIYKWAINANMVNGVAFSGSATGVTPSIYSFGTDTNVDLMLGAQGSGHVTVNSPAAFNNQPTTGGSVKGTLCLDTSNHLYIKTTAGACL